MNKWIVLMLGLVMSATIHAADCQREGAAVESVLVKVRRDGGTPLSAAKVLMPNLSTDDYSAVATLAELYQAVPNDMLFPVFISSCESFVRHSGLITPKVIVASLKPSVLEQAKKTCETKEGQRIAVNPRSVEDAKRQCYGVFYEVLLDGIAKGLREGGLK